MFKNRNMMINFQNYFHNKCFNTSLYTDLKQHNIYKDIRWFVVIYIVSLCNEKYDNNDINRNLWIKCHMKYSLWISPQYTAKKPMAFLFGRNLAQNWARDALWKLSVFNFRFIFISHACFAGPWKQNIKNNVYETKAVVIAPKTYIKRFNSGCLNLFFRSHSNTSSSASKSPGNKNEDYLKLEKAACQAFFYATFLFCLAGVPGGTSMHILAGNASWRILERTKSIISKKLLKHFLHRVLEMYKVKILRVYSLKWLTQATVTGHCNGLLNGTQGYRQESQFRGV